MSIWPVPRENVAPPRVSERTALACAGAMTFLGGLGVLGWATPWRRLASLSPGSIPMAPSTALALVLLGASLILEARRPSPRRTTAVSLLVLVFACVQLVTFLAGLSPALDAFFVPVPGPFGEGRMSPLTAFGLLLASLSLPFVGRAQGRSALGIAGASLALAVCLLGVAVTLGYLFDAPLLYGGRFVPMAFPTALAVGCLGLALVALTPRDGAPLRPFIGPSARARLLRAFLPVVPAILVVEVLVDQVEGLNPALDAALTALASALVVAAVVSYVAHGVGRELERAQAEREDSRRDVDRLVAIVQSSPDAIYALSLDGTIVAWNASAEKLFGYFQHEALGRPALCLMPPGAEHELAAILEDVRAGKRIEVEEATRVRKDGTVVFVSLSESPLRDRSGQVVGVSVIARDMSEQRRTHVALLESETKLRALFESDLVGILFADVYGGIQDANEKLLRMTGYTRDDLRAGLCWRDVTPPEFLPLDEARMAEARERGTCAPYEKQCIHKDGRRFWVLAGFVLLEPERKRVVAFVLDIDARRRGEDELKQLESQLLQAQKMEAVGRLAGGVAHDFNNQLGVILGYTELLMRQASEAQRGKLEQILKATERASGLTRQLLAFSRKQIVDPKVLDLNALVSELEKLLGRLIGENIDIAIVPGADLGQVKADPGQLEQVVMNLCVNARDAMPDGGLLRIETANAELDAGHPAPEPVAPGLYVMLAVSDTGCGIEKEVLSRIFEPFFSTKEPGKGTGLGLAMVYGIVRQAGGYVWAYSEVGRGSTFKIYLPRVDEPAVTPEAQKTPVLSRGWETILLVEDDGHLRAMAREILEDHGYRVIEAASADEAVEIAHRHPEPIHLLVTDIVMPGKNGRALAEALVAARPALRVLYMSGYTDDVLAHSGILASGTLLLEKPFTALALLGRVREALGERGTGENA